MKKLLIILACFVLAQTAKADLYEIGADWNNPWCPGVYVPMFYDYDRIADIKIWNNSDSSIWIDQIAFVQKGTYPLDSLVEMYPSFCGTSLAKLRGDTVIFKYAEIIEIPAHNAGLCMYGAIFPLSSDIIGTFEFVIPSNDFLWIYDNSGNRISFTKKFPVISRKRISIPTPRKPVGVTEMSVTELSLYPNPVIDRATLSFRPLTALCVEIAIYDLAGRKIKVLADNPFAIADQEIQVDLSDLVAGNYFISAGNQTIQFTKK